MSLFKRIFDLYLQGSLHVALSVFCLIRITEWLLQLSADPFVEGFGYFGTIVGYNFIKYDALARSGKPKLSLNLRLFIAISIVAFIGTAYCFFKLRLVTQVLSVAVFVITALYTLPFFPNHKNARSWAGLKIYMVALSWVGVTVVLPVINAGIPVTIDFYIICIKRFILVVVLLFVFEIIDLAWDDPHLKTVPQQIGVARTKQLGMLLMLVFLALELLRIHDDMQYFYANIFIIVLTSGFLFFAHQRRSKYYTSFWTESIPVFAWLALCFFKAFF